MIKAIISSCGYMEDNQISSNIWLTNYEPGFKNIHQAIHAMNIDFLNYYIDEQDRGYREKENKYHFDINEYKAFIVEKCMSTTNDFVGLWELETNFTVGCPSKLFNYNPKEVLIINENFEKILAHSVTKKMLENADTTEEDLSEIGLKKILKTTRSENNCFLLEFDYTAYHNQ